MLLNSSQRFRATVFAGVFICLCGATRGQGVRTAEEAGVLTIRSAGNQTVRITLQPANSPSDVPSTPALVRSADEDEPRLTLTRLDGPVSRRIGQLDVEVRPDPLTVVVSKEDRIVQRVTFDPDGSLRFRLDDHPVLGLGEGGPLPPRETNWRKLPVEFDRRGRLHRMRPRWQADAYGSRNPVPLMIGTGGWALFVATPWGQFDLSDAGEGVFTPMQPGDPTQMQQSHQDQHEQRGKGIPPMSSLRPGVFDLFVFDASQPANFFQDVATLTGKAALPPRWALGYMQSHRTLEDEDQLLSIVDTFRQKQIPLDAVIYLGTGFTPRGWNTPQPSFQFNPEIFDRDPREVIADLHRRHVKVVVHMVPWDRDKLPTLAGKIPPTNDDQVRPGHLADYWSQHRDLVEAGVDAWWPDEGDWFNLFERMKRHQLYFEGPLWTDPTTRPWSLHRNGHLGIARWGGWVWSGDTTSSWKTLEAQIAVGLNHSLSLSPFWGSDIGGFFPTPELTGELYARWFQFGAFCPSFRSHGRTWWTRLPWGWGLSELGPLESQSPPLESELNNPTIEPIVKEYAQLRYRLLSYNYTLAWEARARGLPMMRAMWVHYPDDPRAQGLGDQYLWGRDLLIAPVYKPGASERAVYLPDGHWYDWWNGEQNRGGQVVHRPIDLATMPIYVRAGAVLPIDPQRQYTDEAVDAPLPLRVYPGADGEFTLYEDDGTSMAYRDGQSKQTRFVWDDASNTLTIDVVPTSDRQQHPQRTFQVKRMPDGPTVPVVIENGRGKVVF
ncbi:glycoside hydrolase family 31 protein [Roseiconus nitratireducens]|uniref:Glycoside hydrolase family 31 protein n=1 Tax=Roseiconus nitratireducens TaxID=2605748 RepID=A0A5M6DEN4_9BACT|nr:TIM-barrel domain-containing protein [Roseiconus nitratireducens]KAA5546004.1 glycoside hydrolase family 31 protein [Roseiconus nitratireducens]